MSIAKINMPIKLEVGGLKFRRMAKTKKYRLEAVFQANTCFVDAKNA
jgi:hypothetical protein